MTQCLEFIRSQGRELADVNWKIFSPIDFARLNARFDRPRLNEADWLASTRPSPMLACLAPMASRRKLRLFACASVRHVLPLVTDERALWALHAAERFADGLVTPDDLHAANRLAFDAYAADYAALSWSTTEDSLRIRNRQVFACGAAADAAAPDPPAELSILAAAGLNEAYWNAHALAQFAAGDSDIEPRQAAALRDLFGNPFACRVPDLRCLTPEINSVAAEIYDERAFHRMRDLATLLESASCNDSSIVEHCRTDNEHFRGCWVIDLLCGRC
jgi:hypothetical protein